MSFREQNPSHNTTRVKITSIWFHFSFSGAVNSTSCSQTALSLTSPPQFLIQLKSWDDTMQLCAPPPPMRLSPKNRNVPSHRMKCSVVSLRRAMPYAPVCERDNYKSCNPVVTGEIVLKP